VRPGGFTTRPELLGTFGVVSSTHWLATAAGMAALERGGNAFDAAVTAGFVLQVVEPHLNGLGGDLPVLLWSARDPGTKVVNGQGPAPSGAEIAAFRELGLDAIPGNGLLPACVPGCFGAWMLLLRDFGTMTVAEVLAPAIAYAERGYPLVPRISAMIANVEPLFREEWTESARIYLADGVPAPGSLFRNHDLGATYRRLVREAIGRNRERQIEHALHAYYDGFVAEAIDRYVHENEVLDITGRRHPGLISGADLSGWRARVEGPVSFAYGDYEVFKFGGGQGPVFLQQLALLAGLRVGGLGFLCADHVHLVVEAAKLAFADREAWYGDPDFVEVPLADLLSEGYNSERRTLIGERASLDLRPGSPSGREPRLPTFGSGAVAAGHWTGVGQQAVGESSGDTCHVAVADRHGNIVACTPSGGWLQSSPVIPGLGFCLGTRAQQFNLTEGHPNAVAPGKRPRTTLSPSLAMRDGEPYMAFGTPGGDQQDQWSLNFFLAHADFGLNLQEAVDAPMFDTSHFPSSFYPHPALPGRLNAEDRLPPDVVEELSARGHDVALQGPWALGRLCAVAREPERGLLKAAANPRGMQGYAAGR
jgi:gamma-glutamyltranspeptidase/glutathione hydrolase